jgi:thiol-disulfide isomerase/thioredoxin
VRVLSVSIGPLALPLPPLVLLAAVTIAAWVANRLHARQLAAVQAAPASPDTSSASPAAPGDTVWLAMLLGLLAARLAHLVLHAQAYLASPLAMLDVRDGGWHAPTGFAVGLAWLAWKGRRTPAWRRPLAGAAVVGSLAWVAAGLLAGPRGEQPMPALPLTALADGRPLYLREVAAGRPAVVNLWASWCGPCREEMPVLAAAQAREVGIAFVFVNQGEPPEAVRGYLVRLGLPLRDVLLDPGSRLLAAVGSRGLPTTLFYDAQGRLVVAHMGVLSEAALRVRLHALAPGR